MRDAMEMQLQEYVQEVEDREEDHSQVGTVEVQILLSWFFETSSPGEVAVEVPRAA